MVEVICDTSFLFHIANHRIKNISNLDTEIGSLQFTVPQIVIDELQKLSEDELKNQDAKKTLDFIKNFKIILISGQIADDAIAEHVKNHGGIVATMDQELKTKIKNFGGSILSLHNDRIVLES